MDLNGTLHETTTLKYDNTTLSTSWSPEISNYSNHSFISLTVSSIRYNERSPSSTIPLTLTAIAGAVLSLAIIVENLIVILLFAKVRDLRKLSNLLILNLAVSDLFVGAISTPVFTMYNIMGKWPFSRLVCDIWLALDYNICSVSLFAILAITVDRYIALVDPIRHLTRINKRQIWTTICLTWIVAFLIDGLPNFLLHRFKRDHNTSEEECVIAYFDVTWFILSQTILGYWIPLFVVFALYIKIYRVATRTARNRGRRKRTFIFRNNAGKRAIEREQHGPREPARNRGRRKRTFIFRNNAGKRAIEREQHGVQCLGIKYINPSDTPIINEAARNPIIKEPSIAKLRPAHTNNDNDNTCATSMNSDNADENLTVKERLHMKGCDEHSTTRSEPNSMSLNEHSDVTHHDVTDTAAVEVGISDCSDLNYASGSEVRVMNLAFSKDGDDFETVKPNNDKNSEHNERACVSKGDIGNSEVQGLSICNFENNIPDKSKISGVTSSHVRGSENAPMDDTLMSPGQQTNSSKAHVRTPEIEVVNNHTSLVTNNTEIKSAAEPVNRYSKSDKTLPSVDDEHSKISSNIASTMTERRSSTTPSDSKTFLTVTALLAALVCCWMPYYIVAMVITFCPKCIHPDVFKLVYLIYYTNSAINPICYALANPKFRKALKRLLFKCKLV
ncbi:muscarinic acetylcholine receptor M5-like [Saccoglossus kowalevskii]|uniref:Muscarinic acetylcholine receptor M2-like n=1 Tax=Saccoglossus kowalevskii TaxID=10224 RepID=A0ABM0M734_SACKO|nr:PREDICTED: muscarinic acetylcholine receptor M2-like [Saccoglossus kowalevskii]